MPVQPAGPCLFQRCPERATYRGLCKRHAQLRERDRYDVKAGWLYDRRWKRDSAAFLSEHSTCECGQPSAVTDHDTPHKGNAVVFWDKARWRARCKACHDRKTATIDGGFGRGRKQTAIRDEGWG